jgi:hypothetical protein
VAWLRDRTVQLATSTLEMSLLARDCASETQRRSSHEDALGRTWYTSESNESNKFTNLTQAASVTDEPTNARRRGAGTWCASGRDRLDRELANLAAAVASGGDVARSSRKFASARRDAPRSIAC